MGSGTPLQRLKYFRELIEHGSGPLTDHSHLRATYIPMIESEQVAKVKSELSSVPALSIQFDGTTRLGEAIVCVGRFCTNDFRIIYRVLMLKTTQKHVKGPELAAIITQLLCTTLHLQNPLHVVGISRDSASVNGSACTRLLQNPFVNAASILCICHTLNNVGAHLDFPVLNRWMTPWLELVGGRDPHQGAKALWKQTVAPTTVPGFSHVRWYSKAEICFVIAEHFDKLSHFLDELDEVGYGNATRQSLRKIYTDEREELELELAGMLDMKVLTKETYDLEGNRLEILLVYRRLEALRELGAKLLTYDSACLPNVQAVLRNRMELKAGVEIVKDFPPFGTFSAFIVSSSHVRSTLYPGTNAVAYKVRYPSDGKREDLEEDEIRPLLKISHLPAFQKMCDSAHQAFEYLEKRLDGDCNACFSCKDMYEMCRLLQAFDPSMSSQVDSKWLDELCNFPMFATASKVKLKSELSTYKSLAKSWVINHGSVTTFSDQVLSFWASSSSDITEWAKAAQLTFTLSPNSAACERTFSVLDSMFGENRSLSLADALQASVMLRQNGDQAYWDADKGGDW